MLLMTASRKYRTDSVEWLLEESGIKDISEIEGMSVSEFIEKYSHMRFTNLCLDKLLEMGVLYVPEEKKLVRDLPITTRLKNILLRYDVYVLSDIVKYSRDDIIRFRNLGESTMKELEAVCEQEGIHIISLSEIEDRMLGVKFTYHQLAKMFHMHIWYPEDFMNLTEEQIQELIHLDSGMLKKIKKIQKLQFSCGKE